MIAFLLMLAAMAAPRAGNAWQDSLLDADLARLRAAGEPVTEYDLPADGLPADRNASRDYKAASLLIDPSLPAWDCWDHAGTGAYTLPLTPDERATLRQVVADNGPALCAIAAARRKPAGWWGDRLAPPCIGTGPGQVDLNAERRAGNLLRLAALSAHAEGDDAAAVERVSDLCRLADATERRPTVFNHLVTGGLWSLAVRSAADVLPDIKVGGNGGTSARQLNGLISLLSDERGAQAGLRLALQTERIIGVAEARAAAAGQLTSRFPRQQIGASFLPRILLGPLILADTRFVCRYLQGVEVASAAPDLSSAGRLWPSRMDKEMDQHYGWHPIAGTLTAGAAGALRLHFHTVAERRLGAIAIAIRLHCFDHGGRRPASLADLCPAYLPVVPPDPMTGRSMVYRPTGDDPVVYSVGLDRTDDGGAEPDPDHPWPKLAHRDDVVVHLTRWPRHALRAAAGANPGKAGG